MTTQTICDFCEEPIVRKVLVQSTENDGRVLDFCSIPCFIGFANNKEES